MTASEPVPPTTQPATAPTAPDSGAGSRLAVLCPGQGAQRPGMLAPWADDAAVRPLIVLAQELLGPEMVTMALDPGIAPELLRPTEVAQPLTLLASLAGALATGLAVMPEDPEGLLRVGPAGSGALVAGHSLGSITALCLAGALSPFRALALASARGQAMADCAREHDGGMVALVGGSRPEVLAAVERAGLVAANVNGSRQVVASGSAASLEALVPPAGTRAMPLAVAGAFHSPLMAGAAPAVAEAVAVMPDLPLTVDLVDDADGSVHRAGSSGRALLDALPAKVTQPVRWDLVQDALLAEDVNRVVELPPSGTLAGIARRDLPALERLALRSAQDAPLL